MGSKAKRMIDNNEVEKGWLAHEDDANFSQTKHVEFGQCSPILRDAMSQGNLGEFGVSGG